MKMCQIVDFPNSKTKSINELMTEKEHIKVGDERVDHRSMKPLPKSLSDRPDHIFFEQKGNIKYQKGFKSQGSLASDIQFKASTFKNEVGNYKKRKRNQCTDKGSCKPTDIFVDDVRRQNSVVSCASLSIDDDITRHSSTSHSPYIPLFPTSSVKTHVTEEIGGGINDDEIEGRADETTGWNLNNPYFDTEDTWNVKLVQGGSDSKSENKNRYTSFVPHADKRAFPCPFGECEIMLGSIENLASSLKLHKHGNQLDLLISFIRRHQYGDETIKGMNMEYGAVQFVLLNFPSGMLVNGIEDDKVPFWNTFSPKLIVDGLSIANKILCDSGWVACIHTIEQFEKVKDGASVAGFQLWRSFTVICNQPIYCQVVQPKTKIHSLFITMLHRRGMPKPKPYYVQAGQMDHHACSLSRDLLFEDIDKQEWLCKADGTPWRGGAERSQTIWKFLLLAFTRYADSVVDLIASTGGFIKVASDLGRHALGVEADEAIVQQLLKSYARSIRCHTNIHFE